MCPIVYVRSLNVFKIHYISSEHMPFNNDVYNQTPELIFIDKVEDTTVM